MKKRKYQLKRRAAKQEQTRESIVDAAIALHEEIGPAATTVSALAERAGVQRLTVYKYFPSERAVLQACSSKWLAQHPPPDMTQLPEGGAAERTQAMLLALYTYYRGTEGMWTALYRDRGKMAALEEPMAAFDAYLAQMRKQALAAWAPRRSKRLQATLSHGLQFATWRSLAEAGLKDSAIAELVGDWIRCVAD